MQRFPGSCACWFKSQHWRCWGGENKGTLTCPGDSILPSVVMKDLSEHSLRAPPWWLISCAAPELRSDILAHQTPLSLTGTPLIAQRFVIVSYSDLARRFLHVREFTAYLTLFAFQNNHISTTGICWSSCPSRFKVRTDEEQMFLHWVVLNMQFNYHKNISSLSEMIDASWCIVNHMSGKLNRLLNFRSMFRGFERDIFSFRLRTVLVPTATNGPCPTSSPVRLFEKNIITVIIA